MPVSPGWAHTGDGSQTIREYEWFANVLCRHGFMNCNGSCSRIAGSITALHCNHSTCTDNGSKTRGNYQ